MKIGIILLLGAVCSNIIRPIERGRPEAASHDAPKEEAVTLDEAQEEEIVILDEAPDEEIVILEEAPEEDVVALEAAELLWSEAQALEAEGDYDDALDVYEVIVDDFPDSPLASSAQFRVGVCLEEEDELYDAFEAYQTLLDDFPGKGNLGEILARQYTIGEAFLNGRKRYLLFFRIRSGLGTAEEIFRAIVNNATFSRVSPRAQYNLGLVLQMQGDYEEAITEYNQVLSNYPGTDVIPLALYNMGVCYYEEVLRADYDAREVNKAIRYLMKYVKRFPGHAHVADAEKKITRLFDLKAEKAYDIAEYYEGVDSPEGARLYYREIIEKYPGSRYARLSREKIVKLPEPDEADREDEEPED